MAKAYRFAFLLQRALDQRDEAAQAIAAAVGRLRNARERHDQVVRYRSEYREKLEVNGRNGMPIHQWNDFHAFLQKLNAAVEQQVHEVRRCESNLQSAKDAWQARERDVKAFETLRERHDEREAKREARVEQKLSDDWVNSSHRLRHGGE